MNNSLLIKRQVRTAFSGGLFGVLILFLLPNTVSAFQANSLVIDTTLTGVSLSATTWGDYDNDGDLDVVITGTTDGGNSGAIAELYDNDGSGSFTKNTTVSNSLTGAYRSGAAFGDYDNDGFLDLVIIGYNTSGTPTTTLYHNNGNGTFSTVSGTGFSNGSWASASWGDANNDGYLDLYLGGLPGGSGRFNTIYLNDKDGTFTNANAGILGSAGGDFVQADYDNDGDLDVAIAGFTDASGVQSKFYRNDNGTYTEVSSISNLLFANDNATMEWGDFDNDGDLDLFNAGGGGAKLLINDGNGGLSNSGLSFTSVYESAADWIDYDLDGDLDLLYIGNISGSKSFLYDNNGDGTFTLNTSFSISGAEQGTVDWVDIDNDGDSDLLITGEGVSGPITTLYENTSTTTNSAPSTPTNLAFTFQNGKFLFSWDASTDAEGGAIEYNAFIRDTSSTTFLQSAESDLTNGYRRVIRSGSSGLNNSFPLEPTTGVFEWGVQAIDAAGSASAFAKTISIFQSLPAPSNIVTTDNYDSLTVSLSWDVVNNNRLDYYNIYIETNSTVIPTVDDTTSQTSITLSGFTDNDEYYIYVAAVDTNGLAGDISVYQYVDFRFILQPNTTLAAQLPGGSDMVWVDFDNDGDLDVSLPGANDVLYINNGGAGFSVYNADSETNQVLNQIGGFFASWANIDWTDYNLDGYQDFIITGTPGGTIFVQGTGSGLKIDRNLTWETDTTFISNLDITAVTDWGDFDNDGDPDLLFVTSGTGRIYENTLGEGDSLELSVSGLPGINTFGYGRADFVDINNDGYLDISFSAPFSLYLNNGDKTFSNLPITIQNLDFAYTSWGDMDNDGDLDLAITGVEPASGNGYTAIFKNNGSGSLSVHTTLDPLGMGQVDWGDYDNDGDLDLLLHGVPFFISPSNIETVIYDNDGSGLLTKNTREILIENGGFREFRSASEWGDYDNDGDLDLRISGNTGNHFYENITSQKNTAPTNPSNLQIQYSNGGNSISLQWNESTDVEGGPISYNVYVTDSNNNFKVAAESDTTNGFRRFTTLGNAGIDNSYTLNISKFDKGKYTFAVQAIDGSGGASGFEKFSGVSVNTYFTLNKDRFEFITDTVQIFSRSNLSFESFLKDSTMLIQITEDKSGTWFKDSNNNLQFDSPDSTFETTYVTFNSETDSLLFFSDSPSVNNLTFKVSTSSGGIVDSLVIPVTVTETQPELSGTANQGGWYLLSNPLNTTLGTLFENIWTQGAINADSESGTPNIYTFNPDSAKYIAITTDLDTTKVSAGEGILAYIFPDDNYNDANDPVNGGWPKTLSNYGNPFGENISVPIKNTDVDQDGVTSGSEGFTLMGNPYGFPISIDSVIAKMVEIDLAANRYVYRWEPIEKKYQLYTTGSVNAYESFFVRTVQSGVNGAASFNYNDVHSSARLKVKEESYPIELTLQTRSLTESSYIIRLGEEAETGIDPRDGYYLGSFAAEYANLYSTIGDQPLLLNNLPLDLAEVVEIPLHIHSTETGDHTLNWNLSNLPETWSVELENPQTGKVIDLKEETAYIINFESQQFKTKGKPTPDLFALQSARSKKKGIQSELILRINPGLSTNGEDDLGIPREVELEQNYPNPFNPSSVIRFGVPEQAPVQLEVFDVLGRKVMTLLNGDMKQPGRYNINFDGRSLASGMYIYRLVIGNKVLTKKMTLIK